MTHSGTTVVQRLMPAAGTAVLALTATSWIGKSFRTDAGTGDRSFSFWGLFHTVRHGLTLGVGLVAVLLMAFVAVAVLANHARPAAGSVMAWVAALATVAVLMNVDAGYSAGPGLWLTLIVTVAAAVAGTLDWVLTANGDRREALAAAR